MSIVLKLDTPGNSQQLENEKNINSSVFHEKVKNEPVNFIFKPNVSEFHNKSRDTENSMTMMMVNKPDIVYSSNQLKIQSQQSSSDANVCVSNPSNVNTDTNNITLVTSKSKIVDKFYKDVENPSQNIEKCNQELACGTTHQQQQSQVQKSTPHTVSCTASLIITTSVSPSDPKQTLTKVSTTKMDNIINTNQQTNLLSTHEQVDANKVHNNKVNNGNNITQHQTKSDVAQKMVNTTTKTPATSMANVQKLSIKSSANSMPSQTSNIHKVKTITGVNSQGIVTKNFISKVQGMTKSQALSGKLPSSVTSVTQIINSNNLTNAQRAQQDNQKNFSNQNVQNQQTINTKIHTSNNNPSQSTEQIQTLRKVADLFQKTLTVQRQPLPKTSQSIISSNNIQKGSICGIQKNVIAGQNQSANTQHQNSLQPAKSQIFTSLQKSQTAVLVNNSLKTTTAGNISKSSSVPNISKISTNSTMAMINKAQMTSQSQSNVQHSVQVQHVIPHSVQSQQTSQKQQQPKLNIIQQNATLTSLPVNQKGSVLVNAKVQPQQSQMVLRVGPIKNNPMNTQSGNSVKCISQKVTNALKMNSHQQVTLQPTTLNRNTVNAQPVKIIQQSQQPLTNVISNSQAVQKQTGTIKTIPPLKSPQKNSQFKTQSVKTSINNVNTIKNQTTNTVVHQKTSVRTIGSQQPTSSNVMIHKHQTVKIQTPNVQQKQIMTSSPFSQQVIRTQPGQIKTILPVVSAESHKEHQPKMEPELPTLKEEESGERSQSPVRRMPLPYECLQFVLQDHNYGAPPPRTPPPTTSPSHTKQQTINGAGNTSLQHTFIYNQVPSNANTADDAASAISSEPGREAEPEGEETETAPEGEGDDEDSITRCICEFEHDDGYMICCDRCLVWQHVDCMGIDRSNIPDEYLCEICRPRRVDRQRARTLQMRKREELLHSDTLSDTSSTSSADTDVSGNPTVVKKRNIQQQHQPQLPVSRRKSDSAQFKKINHHNLNSSTNNTNSISNNNNSNINNNAEGNDNNSNNSSSNNNNSDNNLTNNNDNSNSHSNNNNSNNNSNNVNDNDNDASGGGNNSNNNIPKRQKREQHPRQANMNRKKETVKRGPGKRKVKRRMSLNGENESQDAWGSPNMAPLRQWIERYEEAVTNHYSPELRARISSIKVNGSYNDLRQTNISNIVSGKCRLNVHSNSLRFLVATMYLAPNTPVVELRGKYMLSTQHRPSHPSQYGRQHTQRPGPFVFFYRLPREGTEVCVDTRTYGNDARFVRRSCKPNAEVKHCIEKGTLHLYIVTTTAIEKNAEITIRHEQHDLLLSPNSNSSLTQLACACGNPKTCQIANNISGIQFGGRKGSNGAIVENTTTDSRERRRRNRRNTVGDDNDTINSTIPTNPVMTTQSSTPLSSNSTVTTALSSNAKRIMNNPTSSVSQTTMTTVSSKVSSKEENNTSVCQSVQVVPSVATPTTSVQDIKKDKTKLTREERKMEAIIKAIERLEKAELRKQEVQARNAQRKESGGGHSDTDEPMSQPTKPKQPHIERTVRRKKRKGRSRTIPGSSLQNNRRKRLNSADSDLSSCEENNLIMMQSPPQSSCLQSNRDTPFSPRISSNNNNDNSTNNNNNNSDGNESNSKKQNEENLVGLINQEPSSVNNQTIPTAAGLLLALANSSVSGASSPPLQQPAPSKSPTCDSGASSSSQSSTPSTPLSSACLLVAAAVGPLAPGFKFPKTKKVMMNEWLRESPDPSTQTHIQIPHELPQNTAMTPLPVSSSSSSSSPPNSSNNRNTDFLRSTSDPSSEFLTQSYAAKSLATLVQAANSVSGICDSPPQRKQAAITLTNATVCPMSTGSAKKRWLRQAISEECDSPNSRPESPPNEMVAPPKKRRIARESISSDNYTPPTTPTLMLADSGPNNLTLCSGENDFIQQPQSPMLIDESSHKDYDNNDDKNNIHDYKKFQYFPINSYKNSDTEEPTDFKPEDKLAISDYKQHINDELVNTVIQKNEDEGDKNLLDLEYKSSIKCEPDYPESTKVESNFMLLSPIKKESNSMTTENSENIETIDNSTNIDVNLNDSESVTKDKTNIKSENSDNSCTLVVMDETSLEENRSFEDDDKLNKYNKDVRSEDGMSIDEFDVEAQMKKITGDDGNDYKEKIDPNLDKDKSMDGIEGLMDSSKEDSESEDRDLRELRSSDDTSSLKEMPERSFQDFNDLSEIEDIKNNMNEDTLLDKQSSQVINNDDASLNKTMFDGLSEDMHSEPIEEPPKIYQSIPPLSERIRKKPDNSTTKKSLDLEALSHIESTIDMESVDISENDGEKNQLSTALRELLNTNREEIADAFINPEKIKENINPSPTPDQELELIPESQQCTKEVTQIPSNVDHTRESIHPIVDEKTLVSPLLLPPSPLPPPPPPPPPPQEIRRLKDPRTAIPNELRVQSPKEAPAPVKRKLSISEYRKRKQQNTGTPSEPEPSNEASSEKSPGRGRSDSASSGTSSLSSDEDNNKVNHDNTQALTTLPLFVNSTENEERKGGEDGTIGWSAAPTLVERQRENLTERLKREFGLFLSDDEEERARKQGLSTEAILKARKEAIPMQMAAGMVTAYPLPQLPPQPYIPPPGSMPIQYPLYPVKPPLTGQFHNFAVPQPIPPPTYTVPPSTSSTPTVSKPIPQFLVPQAPPGSNPYPPQFVPATSPPSTTSRFPVTTPPQSGFNNCTQTQSPFYNHPNSTPRS
ncbi:homeobox protein 5 isoform X2 [Chelonus insularis]|uniref:homeobox protein 5 isoform X2 n=1 Tax=Chelonus insularis TaxID=460826 RepID=UPI001589AC9E|nr:homeobox protein 5-like isoform X2 [Chelonus insularis]